jgi:hypothetical protein
MGSPADQLQEGHHLVLVDTVDPRDVVLCLLGAAELRSLRRFRLSG